MNGETERWIYSYDSVFINELALRALRGKVLTKSIANCTFTLQAQFLQYSIKIGAKQLDFQVKNTERSILKTNG